ncbi:MAG: protein kinase domain-containing protein [Parahaliea sp.]
MNQQGVSDSVDLRVTTGSASEAGCKPVNEDEVACVIPQSTHALLNKGICAVIADGVSSAEAGREASQFCIQAFIDEYYRTPDTWSVSHAGQQTLSTINLKLFKRSHAFKQEEKGFLCTFSGLVIKSCTAHLFHAGDSRIFRLRQGIFEQLTRDHTINIGKGRSILARAVGMDNNLQIDYSKFSVEEGDKYLLTTDGVHDFISEADIKRLIVTAYTVQELCENLINLALAGGSDDNASCVLVQVDTLPRESRDDYNNKLVRLPFPPHLEPGMVLDGFCIERELFASSRSQVYLVSDTENNTVNNHSEKIVMKTPSITYEDDIAYIDRFIQEEWIGKRIDSPYVGRIISQSRPRTFLYYLMEFVPGISLDKWMQANPYPKPKTAIKIVKQIADALKALHANDTIHQDLKPGNILVNEQQQVKVIDFGSVFVAGLAEIFVPMDHHSALGTASYSDPHYLMGKNTSVQGDIYALATITYELFTTKLPYGDNIEQCRTLADYDRLRYQSAMDYNPVIPVWFDRALEKACSFNLDERYCSLDAFICDLIEPNPNFLQDDPKINSSRSLFFWQLMSGFLVLMLVIVILLFSAA